MINSQLSKYQNIFYVQKHTSSMPISIFTKNMVTRDGDFIVRYVSTQPRFHNGDDIRIVYFNKCTELVKFRYKASCIEVENEQCFIIVPCTVQRCHSRNWNESFHPPRGLNLVNYLSLMRCLSGQG